jgi:hypothetical protein
MLRYKTKSRCRKIAPAFGFIPSSKPETEKSFNGFILLAINKRPVNGLYNVFVTKPGFFILLFK